MLNILEIIEKQINCMYLSNTITSVSKFGYIKMYIRILCYRTDFFYKMTEYLCINKSNFFVIW